MKRIFLTALWCAALILFPAAGPARAQICGDFICNEVPTTCIPDCDACIPNGVCEPDQRESYLYCIGDCHCGNGICDYGETSITCLGDCVTQPVTQIKLVGPGETVMADQEFEVVLKMTVAVTIRSFDFTLTYDPNAMMVMMLVPNPTFPIVMFQDMMGAVRVSGMIDASCSGTGEITLATLRFKATNMMSMGSTYTVGFQPAAMVSKCDGSDITSQLPPYAQWQSATISAIALNTILGAPHMRGYLDLDGDYYMTETDIGMLRMVLTGEIMSGDSDLLSTSARQCDINGNAQVDFYDQGRLDAMVRPVRFISSYPDGICQTTAAATDVQETPVGQGASEAVVIDPGPDGFLDTMPMGDDEIVGNMIFVGPNYKADTEFPLIDDIQVLGPGESSQVICVSAGDDYTLETTASALDAATIEQKEFQQMMTVHPQKGVPAHMVLISPASLTGFPYVISRVQPVPITVQILDDRGRPKTGVSPFFVRTIGTGTFTANGLASIGQIPTDYSASKAGTANGEVTVNFMPSVGNNQVMVSLDGDPFKGIPSLPPTVVNINVLGASTIEPKNFTITADTTGGVFVGDTVELTITLKDGNTPIHGHSDRILLISERNLQTGVDPMNPTSSHPEPIFYDTFENPDLTSWNPAASDGVIASSLDNVSVFGSRSVRLTCGNPGGGEQRIWRSLVTHDFRDLQLSFQWFFAGDFPTGHNIVFEYSANGSTWKTLRTYTGTAIPTRKWISEKFNLTPDTSINNSMFYMRFRSWAGTGGTCPQSLHLDEVNVSGLRTLLNENFEGWPQDLFPGNPPEYPEQLMPGVFITTGPDGIRDTPQAGDDNPRMLMGNGEPNVVYIYAGPDNVLDTTVAGGDDQISGLVITTGANGIAETIADPNDFQEIPYLFGKPYSIALMAGVNLQMDSPRANDDEIVGATGPQPRVVVDNTVTGTGSGQGANGSEKFLFLGRSIPGMIDSYSFMAKVDLAGIDNAKLSFYHLSPFQVDFAATTGGKAQYYAVEVSDNGGKSWVRIWDNAGVAYSTWKQEKIELAGDTRYNLADDFLIRWIATMDRPELDIEDRDGVYFDEILITSVASAPDIFGPVIDQNDGQGTYKASFSSMVPGDSIMISATYWLNSNQPLRAQPAVFDVNFLKALPYSIQVIPSTFTLKACESMKFVVVGRYTTTPEGQVEDMTRFFRLEVNGPARQTGVGEVTAECFTGTTQPEIQVYAKPLIAGLFDPGGGGGGQQTGDVSGRIYKPNLTAAPYAPIWIDMGSGNIEYTHADSGGWYLIQALPAGSNYTMYSSLSGYKKKTRTAVSVVAGSNTTVNLTLLSGTDFDADGTGDSSDTDDDGDGISDSSEYNSSAQSDPDYDQDGIPDDEDAFPGDAGESADNDNDSTGDNADTDDDNDGILDTEEVAVGSDGYITDQFSSDTDSDGMPDGWETNVNNATNPTSDDASSDKDSDGLTNLYEYQNGLYANDSDYDDDGLSDGYEVNTSLTDPKDADSDNDSLNDGYEVNTSSTDPKDADSDGDGLDDGYEVNTSLTFPNDSDSDDDGLNDGYEVSTSTTNPLVADHDGDGLDDGYEVNTSTTDPKDADSDDDNLNDGYEVATSLTDPKDADSDDDNLNDGYEVATSLTDPNDSDSDDDNLNDGYEVNTSSTDPNDSDSDDDGLDDGVEVNTLATNPNDADSDDDLMPDGWEATYAVLNPLVNDADDDPDGDGLTNFEEYGESSDPGNWDSDADNLPDGYETLHGDSLSPVLAEGATADDDGDGNYNVHEYWNGTDPWDWEPVGDEGCFFWGEGDGDGFIAAADISTLSSYMKGASNLYANVIPSTGEGQDMDMDGFRGASDISILTTMLKNGTITILNSRPTEIGRVYPADGASIDMQVGETTHITIELLNGATDFHTAGFGVIFERDDSSTANAFILGGEGAGDGSARYDITRDIVNGQAQVVLRAQTAGVYYVNVRIPQCGSTENVAKYSPAVAIGTLIKVNISE